MIKTIRARLQNEANPEKAKVLAGFFKTGPGQYGEGDVFLGITVPQIRALARQFGDIAQEDIRTLLTSPLHEERLLALLILKEHFATGTTRIRKDIFNFYIRHTEFINNWDLVDLTAPAIVGAWCADTSRSILYRMVRSPDIWSRRIAIVATFYFIRQDDFGDTMNLAEILLSDRHDLMHKAAGWMLREVGKRDRTRLEKFLRAHYKKMPRTMLRYAIEKFPEKKRRAYLKGTV